MELKLNSRVKSIATLKGSNRTFMELKLPNHSRRDATASAGSNRTFMELKLHRRFSQKNGITVLIVPLWN